MNYIRGSIGYADYSWNPVTGCLRGCTYCYAKRMALRMRGRFGYPRDDPFRPVYHPDRVREPLLVRKPSRIFVCDMGELFTEAGSLEDYVVESVMWTVRHCPQHIFLFLTKNPHLLAQYNPWPINAWVGASATDGDMFWEAGRCLGQVDAMVKFVSAEPLLEPIPGSFVVANKRALQWLIIGIQSGPGCQKHWPQRTWVDALVASADHADIPVFQKDNLLKAFPDMKLRKELPRI